MKIVVDIKNLALFTGGISAYFKPLMLKWIKTNTEIHFVLLGPKIDLSWLHECKNVELVEIRWPMYLPRTLRHPFYDNILFPKAIKTIESPDFIFTPYHDVLLPKGTPSVMMIHDSCIGDLKTIYPKSIRYYYELMLRRNLRRCLAVFTVSNSSKKAISLRYNLSPEKIHVVPNSFTVHSAIKTKSNITKNSVSIFYPGGADFRKNVKRLVLALGIIKDKGVNVQLKVTGNYLGAWERELKGVEQRLINAVEFLGYIESEEVIHEYANCDLVVYPTLCEGFGRVCLEAMSVGAKLVCSNLPVLNEVSEDYAIYFNPYNIEDIANKILYAIEQPSKSPKLREDYSKEVVENLFLTEIKRYY
ncbi:glycosyltransferase family 4 protein [Pedobacter glucosidilyticus]|uniref:glycosyltransferase family 4 protein n=1 Tax=Pedobacter glucosidilyticus TaxID=1122941 RepID=UPI0004019C59|nr:glycosyltransferase family 1 protein [Pedobacter glucosidilyticus]